MRFKMTRRRSVGALIVLLVVLGVGGGAMALRAQKKPEDKSAPVALQFAASDLAFVAAKPLARWLPVSGTLQPVRQAIVQAKVAGDVRQITVREGETVQAGQMLLRIHTTHPHSKLIDRRGALQNAKAQLPLAPKTR